MIRKGIYKLQQIKKNQLLDVFGKEKNISIKVYDDLMSEEDAHYEVFSEIILNRFNTNNNAIKRTYRNRFNQFDNLTFKTIKTQNYLKINVHDMAISDGRASCYFLHLLTSNFQNIEYNGSDIAVSYNLHFTSKNSNEYLITDDNDKIIEITEPPFVWNYARKEGSLYFLNNWLKKRKKKKHEALLASKKLGKTTKLTLTDKEYKKIISQNKHFKITNYNLFEKNNSVYNVVRVMNILHYGYFNEEQLNQILRNIFDSLEIGGLFIEGSNEDAGSDVEGAIYKKTLSSFEIITSAEKPSRIAKTVLNFKILK